MEFSPLSNSKQMNFQMSCIQFCIWDTNLVDWNEDPSIQCVEQVGTNNIHQHSFISQNYEAIISQFINWNDDPSGQDVEHVMMGNILKFGDDPTVNQRDQGHFRLKRERGSQIGSYFVVTGLFGYYSNTIKHQI